MRLSGCLLLILVLGMGAMACTENEQYEALPDDLLFYHPTEMALAADGRTLYINNTNRDYRYASAWITQVDLTALLPQLAAGVDAAGLRHAFRRGLKVPRLGGPLALAGHNTAFLVHRGLHLLTKIDLHDASQGGVQMACSGSGANATAQLTKEEQASDCDRAHLFDLVPPAQARNNDVVDLELTDPYALSLVQEDPLVLAVAQRRSSWLTLVGRDGQGALAVLAILKLDNPANLGVASLRSANYVDAEFKPRNILYAAGFGAAEANSGRQPGVLNVLDLTAALAPMATGGAFNVAAVKFTHPALLAPQRGARITSLALGTENPPTSLFLAQQGPDALLRLRFTPVLQADGTLQPDVTQLQRPASLILDPLRSFNVASIRRGPGAADLVAVTGFAAGAVHFLAPRGDDLHLVRAFADWAEVGATWSADGSRQVLQPFASVAVPAVPGPDGRQYLFVTQFGEHSLRIIDISAADPAAFVQRITISQVP